MRLRIGAVSYLNTKPLISGLQHRLPTAELQFDLPSRLADQLAAGRLDVALIPSIEYLRGDGLHIVSNACIACRGPVRSVRLLFRRPPHQVRRLALDEGSRTSVVLARILLQRQFDVVPEIEPLSIDAGIDSTDADAVLVIGDRAMHVDSPAFEENWDLGEQWLQLTGLPFVFAMWVAATPNPPQALIDALQASRDAGVADAPALAAAHADAYGISQPDCLQYFREQLYFYLGEREMAGLDLFRRWAIEGGLLDAKVNLACTTQL